MTVTILVYEGGKTSIFASFPHPKEGKVCLIDKVLQ